MTCVRVTLQMVAALVLFLSPLRLLAEAPDPSCRLVPTADRSGVVVSCDKGFYRARVSCLTLYEWDGSYKQFIAWGDIVSDGSESTVSCDALMLSSWSIEWWAGDGAPRRLLEK
jgi:hypothetical protein